MPTATGAPRDWNPDHQFVQVPRSAVEALGIIDAYVFSLIRFRTTNVHRWTATVAEIAAECALPRATTRKALDRLRDGGYVTTDRSDPLVATLSWAIRWDGDAEETEAPTGRPEMTSQITSGDLSGHTPRPERSSPPMRRKEELPEDTHAADAAERVITHHADLIGRWTTPPRVTAQTRTIATRLVDAYGVDTITSLITYAQQDDFWRTCTKTLAKVEKHADTIREQQRGRTNGGYIANRHREDPTSPASRARARALDGHSYLDDLAPGSRARVRDIDGLPHDERTA